MKMRWVAPPNWPTMPAGFSPPAGWEPDESWPDPPPGWQFWQQTDEPEDSWVKAHVKALSIAGAAVVVVIVGVIVLVGTGGSSKPKAPATIAITGTMTLSQGGSDFADQNFLTSAGRRCNGNGGYDDLSTGAGITVTNPVGTVIATGSLGVGRLVGANKYFGECVFSFTIPAVPIAKIYGIEVSHRGVLHYTPAQIRAHKVQMTIGS